MEYCGSHDLHQKIKRYIHRKEYIDERVIWVYLIQVRRAQICRPGLGIEFGDRVRIENGSGDRSYWPTGARN